METLDDSDDLYETKKSFSGQTASRQEMSHFHFIYRHFLISFQNFMNYKYMQNP